MEGVLAGVVIVEDDFYDLILCEYERICVVSIDERVRRVSAGRERCVESYIVLARKQWISRKLCY